MTAQLPPPPNPPYGVILADPPWTFETYSDKGKGRSAENHYACMSLPTICALPIECWATQTCVLYLWATTPQLVNALRVMKNWAFHYKTNFVWVKERMGTGYWARNRHEHLLVGTRGRGRVCPRFNDIAVVSSVIQGQQREHSRKPDRAVEIIEHYHPGVRKLEMFARERRAGWDSWGLETEKFSG